MQGGYLTTQLTVKLYIQTFILNSFQASVSTPLKIYNRLKKILFDTAFIKPLEVIFAVI